ncbi:cation-translocating P-type ATPase [Chloroflexus sp.]|uniref:cation-translocating P-type ATPase n=1 Tax=Chloroflexus sp. TaxID=1904827 RepID=UPI002630532F|nr:cation-translocating P-type ATPase [uncultured Chloroflexus sp.]
MAISTPMRTEPRSRWHTYELAEVYTRLNSSPDGLTSTEAANRLAQYGPNELQAAARISPWAILLAQFQNVLIIILLIATGLSLFLGHGIESIAIIVIVLFAVLLGFVQEYRAERAIEALRRLAAPNATVLRDNSEQAVPARELVPGDIVLLRAGDRIPADLRLIEAVNLQIEEAALTGESLPVEKSADAIIPPEAPVAERKNMVYAGTSVSYGRGRGIVVATGMQTEFGAIASMLQTIETGRTPLQDNLDRVGHTLARAALIIVAVITLLGFWRGQPLVEMIIFGIALAVAVVPEALPAVVTISLAIGVQRMVKRNALMRRLPAVETLGSTSVICTDKTGTLTKDEMTARRLFVADEWWEITGSGYAPVGEFRRNDQPEQPDAAVQHLLRGAALASDARVTFRDERWQAQGDPTEAALVVAAAKAGLMVDELVAQTPRVAEIPFSSETKRMITLHNERGVTVAYAKGAPEVIVPACSHWLTPTGPAPFTPSDQARVLNAAQTMAGAALRVLAIATKAPATLNDAEHDLTLLGLVGMIDPPRPEAKTAIQTCQQAGIRVVMITGDHPLTATAIARELGLLTHGRVMTGVELDALNDDDFARIVETVDVYARVAPAHKLRVVTALQQKGYVVAMTGDGVNDAPALKKADIGIAMGITGTDVTKEAAAMTITDDNFASIVAAVEEGRRIFGNIKKYLMYLLSSNIGEITLMAGATLAGLPLPLTAVQILYVNLATDGLPALALAVDPPDDDLMRQPPRDPRRGIFTRPVVGLMLIGGLWSALVNLSLFVWALQSGRGMIEAMTMTFVSLVLIQFFKAYNFRSDHLSVFHRPFANRWLNLAIVWELLLLAGVVYLPFLHEPFGTFPLTINDWLIVALVALTIVPVLEIAKWILRQERQASVRTA